MITSTGLYDNQVTLDNNWRKLIFEQTELFEVC